MSGSIAAIAAYDGTGTQSYGTTDKSLPGVKSIFWNENDTDKYYVNGSCYAELECNIESKTEIDKKPTYIFTIPNDYDAVDQIKLALIAEDIHGVALRNIVREDAPIKDNIFMIIEKIEFCVGNQIICTQYSTQLTSNNNYNDSLLYLNIVPGMTMGGANYAYLLACANNQTVQLKVYIKNSSEIRNALGLDDVGDLFVAKINVRAFANFYSMTNVERNMLLKQTLPKPFPITQYSDRITVPSELIKNSQIIINCDHFNIDCSYIEISYFTYHHNNLKFDAELFLNSMSYSGILPNELLKNLFANHQKNTSVFIPLRLNNVSSLTNQTPSTDQIIFDKSGLVPLSRYDSIRIVLTLGTDPDVEDHISNNLSSIVNSITATAYGLCTALYQNGAVTFNNF